MILYLHGFRSSPQSFKARLIAERMQALGLDAQYACPKLPASPRAAIELALNLVEHVAVDRLTLIGSSLGGFYANWLAELLGCRAVLLNPAVKPPRDLEKYVGVTTEFHSGEPFEFKREYIAQLQAMTVEKISRPERYFLIAATGDEVLDWREMAAHYPGAQQRIVSGSDHGLSDFALYLDEVMQFCGVDSAGSH